MWVFQNKVNCEGTQVCLSMDGWAVPLHIPIAKCAEVLFIVVIL